MEIFLVFGLYSNLEVKIAPEGKNLIVFGFHLNLEQKFSPKLWLSLYAIFYSLNADYDYGIGNQLTCFTGSFLGLNAGLEGGCR